MKRLSEDEKDVYLEWYVEGQFVQEIEDAGWVTFKGDRVKRGFPDRFLFGPEETVLIVEFKKTGARKNRRGEKLQDYHRAQFRKLGFRTLKCVGWDAACDLLEELLEVRRGN